MANKTPNYGLTKPLPEEFYDINVHNANMDKIDTELKNHKHTAADVGAVNPNLLRNWYFGDPVNQRGQTEYGSVQYGIDGWHNVNGYSKSAVTVDGYTLTANGGSAYFLQTTELKTQEVVGKPLTISVLFSDGTFVSGTKDCPESGTLNFFYAKSFGFRISSTDKVQLNISAPNGTSVTMKAIKLELGTAQTLVHQDDSGEWVLNEIPNKAEEEFKCIHSTADSSDTYANTPVSGFTYGTEDIQAGSASRYATGHLHFVIE